MRKKKRISYEDIDGGKFNCKNGRVTLDKFSV